MITKRFEVNGKKASLLGYGAMRLPTVDGGHANPWAPNMSDKAIDQKLVNRQVRRMLDLGINYFDVAPAYCRGEAEGVLGEALRASGAARESYILASKLSNFAPGQQPLKACKDLCVRTTSGDDCKACVRKCPVQAIHLVKGFPVVDRDVCIGCGACEHVCPARPESAIYVKGYEAQRIVRATGAILTAVFCLVAQGAGHADCGEGPGTYFAPAAGTANVVANVGQRPGAVKKTVAFLGGSITEMDGFRPRVMNLLRAKYPEVDFEEIAAGLSSTCSDAGAFRLAEDVLSKGTPDLFIVEAAVNDDQDGHFPEQRCIRGMEGCVRQVLLKNPACAVVIGLMVNRGQYLSLKNGVMPLQYRAHARVAAHYNAAIANVGSALAAETAKDGMTWERYGDCHPSPEGCDLGAKVMMEAIGKVFDPAKSRQAKPLPEPLDGLSYFHAQTVSPEKVRLGSGWRVSAPDWKSIPGVKRDYFTRGPAIWSETEGSELSFDFSGTAVGAFLTAGPDAGGLEASVDGGDFMPLELRANYGALHYPYVHPIADDLTNGPHTVKLRVTKVQRNRKPCSAVRIHRLYTNAGYANIPGVAENGCLHPDGQLDARTMVVQAVRSAQENGGGTVRLADGEYHFYSSSATNMRFHVSNHDQPDVRPVFLPFIGVTNVSVVAKNAKFVMHGMGTAILVRDSLGVSFKGIEIEWEKPFFAKAEIVGFEGGKTRVRFPARDKVVVEDGKLRLCGEDWKVDLRGGNVFDRKTREMIERTADVIFSGKGSACENGDFLIDVDLSKIGAGAKVGDVYVMRNGYRPHPIVCLDRAKDTTFEDFVFRDGFGMGILAQLSENVTLRGGGCYPRNRNEYNSNTIDATHFSNCRGTVTVENCRFEGMMDDALNVHSTSMGIVVKPSANSIRCRYMHPQAIGFGVFAPGDAVRFIAGKTLENGAVGRVKSVETHDEREITLTLEEPIPSAYGVGDAVENADWQCAVVFRNNVIANNRARGVLFTTPHRIICEGNFFDHVSGSAILFAGDAQGWYESGACEDVVIRKNRFRDCLTSVFQYCDGLVSIHPEVKDIEAQKRRYHRNILIEDNDIETFDVPLLYALSAEDVVWRNNRVTKHDRYRGWEKPELIKIGCGRVEWQ